MMALYDDYNLFLIKSQWIYRDFAKKRKGCIVYEEKIYKNGSCPHCIGNLPMRL